MSGDFLKNPFEDEGNDQENNEEGLIGSIKNPFASQAGDAGDDQENNEEGILGSIKNPFASENGDDGELGNINGLFDSTDNSENQEKSTNYGFSSIMNMFNGKKTDEDKKKKMLEENPFSNISANETRSDDSHPTKPGDKQRIKNSIKLYVYWVSVWGIVGLLSAYTAFGLFRLKEPKGEGIDAKCYINNFLPVNDNQTPFGNEERKCEGTATLSKQNILYKPTQSILGGFLFLWLIESKKYIEITLNLFFKKLADLVIWKSIGGDLIGVILTCLILTSFFRFLPYIILFITGIFLFFQVIELFSTAQFPWRKEITNLNKDKPNDFGTDLALALVPYIGTACGFQNNKEGICDNFEESGPGFSGAVYGGLDGIFYYLKFSLNLIIKSLFFTLVIFNPFFWIIYYVYLAILVFMIIYKIIYNQSINESQKREQNKDSKEPQIEPDRVIRVIKITQKIIFGLGYIFLSGLLIINIVAPIKNIFPPVKIPTNT